MTPNDILAAPVHRPAAPVARIGSARAALATIAERIADDGIEAHHGALVAALRDTDLIARYPVLAAIAMDATAPPIARARAVGRLAAAPESVTTAPAPMGVRAADDVRRPAA